MDYLCNFQNIPTVTKCSGCFRLWVWYKTAAPNDVTIIINK